MGKNKLLFGDFSLRKIVDISLNTVYSNGIVWRR